MLAAALAALAELGLEGGLGLVEREGLGECLAGLEGLDGDGLVWGEALEGEEGDGGWGEGRRCEEAWMERRRAMRSEASLAALRARVRGMMRSDWANSPMASCSREPCWRGGLAECGRRGGGGGVEGGGMGKGGGDLRKRDVRL